MIGAKDFTSKVDNKIVEDKNKQLKATQKKAMMREYIIIYFVALIVICGIIVLGKKAYQSDDSHEKDTVEETLKNTTELDIFHLASPIGYYERHIQDDYIGKRIVYYKREYKENLEYEKIDIVVEIMKSHEDANKRASELEKMSLLYQDKYNEKYDFFLSYIGVPFFENSCVIHNNLVFYCRKGFEDLRDSVLSNVIKYDKYHSFYPQGTGEKSMNLTSDDIQKTIQEQVKKDNQHIENQLLRNNIKAEEIETLAYYYADIPETKNIYNKWLGYCQDLNSKTIKNNKDYQNLCKEYEKRVFGPDYYSREDEVFLDGLYIIVKDKSQDHEKLRANLYPCNHDGRVFLEEKQDVIVKIYSCYAVDILAGAKMYSLKNSPKLDTKKSGTFLVGKHLKAGKYTIQPEGSVAYYYVTSNISDLQNVYEKKADLSRSYMHDKHTIELKNGQYVYVKDGFLKKK